MAVSMATLGFSFPAHKMPNQGWRGTVSSLVGEKILSFLSILLGPIHTREGAGRGGLGLLDPQRPSDSTPLMTDHQRLKKARGSTELVCDLVQRELGSEGGEEEGARLSHTPVILERTVHGVTPVSTQRPPGIPGRCQLSPMPRAWPWGQADLSISQALVLILLSELEFIHQ